ncbi:leucine-rich repeat-containing protein 20 isoform X1 [Prorops nasuta]|uniref:leucine-rich repeat-containing protein 20 isoform X1 n=1 Tax=Prorops nasuta TaxID=863751 RepID=UPI0034CDEB64
MCLKNKACSYVEEGGRYNSFLELNESDPNQRRAGVSRTSVSPLEKMANAVTRVILRCEEAQENESLDLSECQLMQVPDAVYHLMRHTELKRCDLSGNVITKIPPKFAVKFSLISELNLSHNQMSKLPEELSELQALERLDISHNAFINLPPVACRIPRLKQLLANNNSIIDVDVERLRHAPELELIDLRANPLTQRMLDLLATLTRIRIELSPRQMEDWEDLTI